MIDDMRFGPSENNPPKIDNMVLFGDGMDVTKEKNQLEDLNIFLDELAKMDRVGIRRKILVLENYINNLKNKI
jgi:hypothetical protein